MIKILIADNHPIVRKGLELLFTSTSNVQVVGSVESGDAILEFIKNHPVDILLTEVNLPNLNGLTVLRYLKNDFPDLKIIVLSGEPEEVYAINAIKAGAAGYISKTENIITISDAISKVYGGGIHLSNQLTQQLAFGARTNRRGAFYKRLSTREAEVLKLLTIGRKNKEISKELDINEKTVSTYKVRLMRKLKVNNLVDLINQAKLNEQLS